MMEQANLDIDYKLKLKKMLWKMGYFCALEIVLSSNYEKYGKYQRQDLTDIDVYGIIFDDNLQFSSVLAECKSGKDSLPTRIFFLRGMMDYLKVQRAYYVKKYIDDRVKPIASQLDIMLLSEDSLNRIIDETEASKLNYSMFDYSANNKFNDFWGINIKGRKPNNAELKLKKIYQYFQYKYWISPGYKNINTIISYIEDFFSIYSITDMKSEIFFLYASTLFSISILKMAGSAISKDRINFVPHVREYFFGGVSRMSEKELLKYQIEKLTNKNFELEPDYYNEIVEMVNRIIKYSSSSKDVPRFLEAFLFESIINENKFDLSSYDFSVHTVKLAKDIVIFLKKFAHVPEQISKDLLLI